jgi:Phage integrase family
VFPAPLSKGKAPTSKFDLTKTTERIRGRTGIKDLTAHDLRRTAASRMTGMGIPRLTVSKILNHVEPGVTAVYDRHSYDREKREALGETRSTGAVGAPLACHCLGTAGSRRRGNRTMTPADIGSGARYTLAAFPRSQKTRSPAAAER